MHCLAEVVELNGVGWSRVPSEASVRATHDALKTIAHDGIAVLGLVENMLGFNCDSCHTVRPLFPQGNFPGLALAADVPILGRLPFDPRLADCAERGALFVREHPGGAARQAVRRDSCESEQEIARRAVQPPLAAEDPA